MEKHSFLSILIISILLGCGSSSHQEEAPKIENIEGYLIDSPIQGVQYHCEDGNIGITQSSGKFSCQSFPIQFFIGGLYLGSIETLPNDGYVFPQDLVGVKRDNVTDENVIKIATLLQSLDIDKNVTNGIVITPQVSNSLSKELDIRNLNLEALQREVQSQNGTIVFLEEREVITHLESSLRTFLNIAMEEREDILPPTITLNGASEIVLFVGEQYQELGISSENTDLTIETIGEVDTTRAGTYTILYIATDNIGNSSVVSRTVIVRNRPINDNHGGSTITPPVIPPSLTPPTIIKDLNHTQAENNISWAKIEEVGPFSLKLFWKDVSNATGYTLYLSTNQEMNTSEDQGFIVNVEEINSTIVTGINYDIPYYFNMRATKGSYQSNTSDITRFILSSELSSRSTLNQFTKLNDTGVYEAEDNHSCASMHNWVDCKITKDRSGNAVPFGQDGLYATGIASRGKGATVEQGCYKDASNQLLWYEHDNQAKYTAPLPIETDTVALNKLETECSIYLNDTNQTRYCNTLDLIKMLNQEVSQCECHNWRLPTRDELRNIVYYGATLPSDYPINSKANEVLTNKATYTPSVEEREYRYWSSDLGIISATSNSYAWTINLITGEEKLEERSSENRVMLVCNPSNE